MGFRFRKSIKLFPGVRLNISKTGLSTSIGGRGATINLGKNGARGTVGIPGSGLSYSERLWGGRARRQQVQSAMTAGDPLATQNGPVPNTSKAGCGCLVIVGILFGLILLGSSADQPTPPAEPVQAPVDYFDGSAIDSRIVSATSANCRLGPSTSTAVVASLKRGDKAREIDQKNGWTKVFNGNDACWISSDLLEQ